VIIREIHKTANRIFQILNVLGYGNNPSCCPFLLVMFLDSSKTNFDCGLPTVSGTMHTVVACFFNSRYSSLVSLTFAAFAIQRQAKTADLQLQNTGLSPRMATTLIDITKFL